MAAGLGAESLAAKFKQGGALETYRGKWLLVEAADTATEDRLAKSHGVLLLRAIVGEPLHMDDKKNGQFTSFQQRNRGLEKEVKDLERVVSLAAAMIEELQLELQLPDRHLERRAKQADSPEARLPAQAEKAWAFGQATAQTECAKTGPGAPS